MHRLLGLQHHRHTGKRLQHHHTSYKGLLLVVLAFGLSLALIQKTGAQTLDVNARINAPIPNTAPAIISPVNGIEFEEPLLVVSGTCEILSPAYAVTIWTDNIFAGSTPCRSDGTFTATISVSEGSHSLRTGSTTLSNQHGPDGTPISIKRFKPLTATPLPTKTRTTAPQPPAETVSQPVITLGNVERIVFTPDKQFELLYEINQGTAPYQMNVDWGDGTRETMTVDSQGKQKLEHTYKYPGSYTITLKLADSKGQTYQIVLAAQTYTKLDAPVNYTIDSSPSGSWIDNVHVYIWGVYGAIVTAFLGFWMLEHFNLLRHPHLSLDHKKQKLRRKR